MLLSRHLEASFPPGKIHRISFHWIEFPKTSNYTKMNQMARHKRNHLPDYDLPGTAQHLNSHWLCHPCTQLARLARPRWQCKLSKSASIAPWWCSGLVRLSFISIQFHIRSIKGVKKVCISRITLYHNVAMQTFRLVPRTCAVSVTIQHGPCLVRRVRQRWKYIFSVCYFLKFFFLYYFSPLCNIYQVFSVHVTMQPFFAIVGMHDFFFHFLNFIFLRRCCCCVVCCCCCCASVDAVF